MRRAFPILAVGSLLGTIAWVIVDFETGRHVAWLVFLFVWIWLLLRWAVRRKGV